MSNIEEKIERKSRSTLNISMTTLLAKMNNMGTMMIIK